MDLEEAFAHLDRTYFGEQQREREEIDTLPKLLDGCELFIDVGASLGQYTYFANQAMAGGRIIAFEPDPDRFAELERRCRQWSQEGSNAITAINAAVGDGRESITFFVTGTHISGGFFPVPERSDRYRPIEVPQVMLDDYYQPGVKTLIKIDVEGAELRVLRGAEAHLAGGTTYFLTEVTGWGDRDRGYTAFTLLRFLLSRGLRIDKVARGFRTFNYLLSPAPRASAWRSVLRSMPILLTRIAYRRWAPKRVRDAVERARSRRRLAYLRD